LSSPSGATLARPQATGTITNDDAVPSISIADTTAVEGNSGNTNAVFTVTLSAPSGVAATLSWFTQDGTAIAGSDYQSSAGNITFAPGQTTATFSVPVYGDTLPEANETFSAYLYNNTNSTLARSQATGTIIDDEPISLLANDASVTE